jgi:1,4-alpha-glucan branching enzyme
VVVVASLDESTFQRYELGFPRPGRWREALNGDFYDGLPNPRVAGNGGAIRADGPPMHGLPHSAALVIPANGLLVLVHEP